MIFRPDIKPPMWGPPDAVQYAVRANAERMEIAAENVRIGHALLEGAGTSIINIMNGSAVTLGSGSSWDSGAIVAAGNTIANSAQYDFLKNGPFTVVYQEREHLPYSFGMHYLVESYHATGRVYLRRNDASGVGDYACVLGGTTATALDAVIPTGPFQWAVSATGSSFDFYLNGKLAVANTSYAITALASTINIIDADWAGGLIDGMWWFSQALNADQIAQLHATPYALLMPVSRPVYFDLGAGGVTFSASCGSILSSSDIQASIARSLAASAAGSTTASDILAAVARILTASADGSLTGSDIAVSIAAQKVFEAACNASLQSTDVLLSLLRSVQAQCSGSVEANDISLNILRSIVASCAANLDASDVIAAVVTQRLFEAICSASLQGEDVLAVVARQVASECSAEFFSSSATIENILSFYTYSLEAYIAAHTAFRDLLDSGVGNATIKIKNASNTLLANIVLADPCGTVNGTTGQLVFSILQQEDSALASGAASYAEFCDGSGTAHLSVPAVEGATAISGYVVISTLNISAGSPVSVVSATIG